MSIYIDIETSNICKMLDRWYTLYYKTKQGSQLSGNWGGDTATKHKGMWASHVDRVRDSFGAGATEAAK